ncbi:AN1-type zinc finger protein 1 [Cephus cinctus]|uniref:AN1-type zinc finger protein 1 n=1 Tax=Cephus cinctus TaxID=211228 RepID=A0AAJ7FCW8_CEPCN|nr:AN1-type zinc finger protein 1 [Cephus cinctus]XP_015585547.1 AN1-type zinc finger protein 1 [Cephus cinctus]
MEFPSVGIRCSVNGCKQLDFLPFTCLHCQAIFCKKHFNVTSHACSKFIDNVVSTKENSASYCCSQDSCEQTSPVEMNCVKCRLHFCLAHRYHGCLEISEEQKAKELEKWQKPKQEFVQAKATVDQQITNSLKKAKNTSMANKVQLMRLKGQALGPTSIPSTERRYFLIYPPITNSAKTIGKPKAAFVCVRWSLGRAIDGLASILGIPNTNNVASAKKLKLFHHISGSCVSEKMDVLLSELLDSSSLTDGQSLILEYSDTAEIDSSLYN